MDRYITAAATIALIASGPILHDGSANAQSSAPSRSPAELHASGKSAYDRGLYSLASIEFYEIYKKYPQDPLAPEALYQLARSLVQLKRAKDACITLAEMHKVYRGDSGSLSLEKQLACSSSSPTIPPSLLTASKTLPPPQAASTPTSSARQTQSRLGPSQTAIDLGMTDRQLAQGLCAGTITLPAPARNAVQMQAKLKADSCRALAGTSIGNAAQKLSADAIAQAAAAAFANSPSFAMAARMNLVNRSRASVTRNLGLGQVVYNFQVQNIKCSQVKSANACSYDLRSVQESYGFGMRVGSYLSPWRRRSDVFAQVGGSLRSTTLSSDMSQLAASTLDNKPSRSANDDTYERGKRQRDCVANGVALGLPTNCAY